jgi:hypothetical protein
VRLAQVFRPESLSCIGHRDETLKLGHASEESTGYIHEINEDHAQAKLYNGFARLQVQVSNLDFALPGTFVRFMNLRTLRDRSAPELMNRTEPLREVSFRILYGLADSEALRCAYAG